MEHRTPALAPAGDTAINTTRCIVPIDGMRHSERSLTIGARLARALGGAVEIVCYSHGPITSQFRTDLAQLVDRAVGPVPAQLDVLPYRGPVNERIVELVASRPGAVVCMAAHGRDRAPGILGSVTDAVVHACTQPVVLVGPGVRLRAFDPAGLVLSAGAETDRLRSATESWARRFGSSVQSCPLLEATQAAVTLRASVVAVEVPRLGRMTRLLHGSHVADLVHDAPCPVLAVGALD